MLPGRWRLSSPALQGEREAAVNTIAQGMPVVPALPVVTAACFLLLQAGHGCGQHPAFPAPSLFRGRRMRHHPGAFVPREGGGVSFFPRIVLLGVIARARGRSSIPEASR